MNDIQEASYESNSDTAKHFLLNISCTMSDRAATEKKFHKLLEEARTDLLRQLYENWDLLSNSEQEEIRNIQTIKLQHG